MIQDIDRKIDITYHNYEISDEDYVVIIDGDQIILRKSYFIKKKDLICDNYYYLLESDEERYFLALDDIELDNFESYSVRSLFNYNDQFVAFISTIALHNKRFLLESKFCGKCGNKMKVSKVERAMKCESCNHVMYPRIAPAVIVAVVNGDKLLLTRYANREYKNYALVAGYMEIGENLRDTVMREVSEEVGLKVKNIKYFDSQPWGLSQSFLVGLIAELDGDSDIVLETNELSFANFFSREELNNIEFKNFSLTQTMIDSFRQGKF